MGSGGKKVVTDSKSFFTLLHNQLKAFLKDLTFKQANKKNGHQKDSDYKCSYKSNNSDPLCFLGNFSVVMHEIQIFFGQKTSFEAL